MEKEEQFGLDYLIELFQENEFVTFSIRGVGERTHPTYSFKKAVEQVIKIIALTEDALLGCNQAVSAHELAEVLEMPDIDKYGEMVVR